LSDEKGALIVRVEHLEKDCGRIDQRLFDLHSEVLQTQGTFNGELKSLEGYVDKINVRVKSLEDEFNAQRTRLWAVLLLVIAEVIANVFHLF